MQIIFGGKVPRTKRDFKGNSLVTLLSDYTIVDIETTGLDPYFEEIIEIAAIRIRNNKVTETFQSFIKPEDEIDEFITELTGITNDMVKDAPEIESVLPRFLDFLADDVIVGHNIHFDVNFIYDFSMKILDSPVSNDVVDTLRLSRRLFTHLGNHRLNTLAEHFDLASPNHRALADCLTAFELYKIISNHVLTQDLNLNDLFNRSSKGKYQLKADSITTENTEFDEEHPLYSKVCVFTGTLEKMKRKDAMQHVVNLGGICGDNVTKKTNYLVLGNLDYAKSIKDGKSSKWKKAETLILSGQELEIVSENVFYDLLVN